MAHKFSLAIHGSHASRSPAQQPSLYPCKLCRAGLTLRVSAPPLHRVLRRPASTLVPRDSAFRSGHPWPTLQVASMPPALILCTSVHARVKSIHHSTRIVLSLPPMVASRSDDTLARLA
jgi:hypothetical protein